MEYTARIEVPKGSSERYKVGQDGQLVSCGQYKLPFPANYGGILDTRAPDGQLVDIIVASRRPLDVGALALTRVVGVMHMLDAGIPDPKVIAVLKDDVTLESVTQVDQIPDLPRVRIVEFLTMTKAAAGDVIEIQGWGGADAAVELIEEAKVRYLVHA